MTIDEIVNTHQVNYTRFSIADYNLRRFKGLESGCCLACTFLFLSRPKGELLTGLVHDFEAWDKRPPADDDILTPALVRRAQQIMAEQRQVNLGPGPNPQHRPRDDKNERLWRWMQHLGFSYNLEKVCTEWQAPIELADSINSWLAGRQGIVVIGMNSNNVGHAVGFDMAPVPGSVAFFEPNYGLFQIPNANLAGFVNDFFDESDGLPKYDYNRWFGVEFARANPQDIATLLQRTHELMHEVEA